MNAIELLKNDHEKARKLMSLFKKTHEKEPETAISSLRELCTLLGIHSILEEEHFYPAAQGNGSDKELVDEVNEGFEEHAIVDQLIEEIQEMSDGDPELLVKGKVMIESVEHHMKEEEKELMPDVEKALSSQELENLGKEMEEIQREMLAHS